MAFRPLIPLILISVLTLSACPNSAVPVQPQSTSQNTPSRYYLPLNLGNGQDIHLDFNIQGKDIQGELIVTETGLHTHIFSRSFTFGRYNFSGSYTPPRGFALSGVFPEPIGAFNLNGSLPTQTDPGHFEFTQGGETVSDTLPALNTLPSPPPPRTLSSSSPKPGTSPIPVSPSPSPSATPISAKQWTAEELNVIRDCLASKTAAYQDENRRLVIQTVAKIAANVSLASNPDTNWTTQQRQDKLNEAGAFAVNSEAKLGSNCIP